MTLRHFYIKTYVAALMALAMVCLSSCSTQESKDIAGYGWINIQASVQEIQEAPMDSPLAMIISSADSVYVGTWQNIDDFNIYENYYAGSYHAIALSGKLDAEGYGCPTYAGHADFVVPDGKVAYVNLECTLQQALINVSLTQNSAIYSVDDVEMHTPGYAYNPVDFKQTTPLLIMPGRTVCLIKISNAAGKEVTLSLPEPLLTSAATLSDIKIELVDDQLTVLCNSAAQHIELTDDVFDAALPAISTIGFTSGTPVKLIEGYPSASQLIMDIFAPAGLKNVSMTIKASYLDQQVVPKACDLMNLPANLAEMGLQVDKLDSKSMKVDFTKFIEGLNVDYNDEITFLVEACDKLGRTSEIAQLVVEINSVELSLLSVSPAVLGENRSIVKIQLSVDMVEADDFTAKVDVNGELQVIHAEVIEVDKENKTGTVVVEVPEGIDNVPIIIEYMGLPKLKFDVPRSVPPFNLSIDAFANSALATIVADNIEQANAICKYVSIYTNQGKATIAKRNLDDNILWVIGLDANKQYEFRAEVLPQQYVAEAKFETEDNAPVPMGDFEDFEDLFSYANMPSGGTYSTAAFPIFSNQNFQDFDVKWVKKHWTSVNAKTFCKSATRYNTWYMQPSTSLDFVDYASGFKSMHLVSVGWSVNGEEIPPYMQAPNEFVPYSLNVPNVQHRAAGKLFLGSYKFDPYTCTEQYTEGLAFNSRPSSLNGFYKYIPDDNNDTDLGLVVVELLGRYESTEQIIATGRLELQSAPDFVSFNLPLDYKIMNVKASRIKIMFASSIGAGDIEWEDANVPVSANVPGACFTGSELWIDNLSFSY